MSEKRKLRRAREAELKKQRDAITAIRTDLESAYINPILRSQRLIFMR